jgi:hypothetical protein
MFMHNNQASMAAKILALKLCNFMLILIKIGPTNLKLIFRAIMASTIATHKQDFIHCIVVIAYLCRMITMLKL